VSPDLRRSLLRSGALLIGCGLIGWLIGYPIVALLLGSLLCLGWQWLHLYRLDGWLRQDLKAPPPRALDGFWREVFQQFLRLRLRGRKRKRKLSRTLHNFQQGASAIPDAIVVLNSADQVVWCNQAAQRMLGLDPVKDRGLALVSLIRHPDFVAYFNRRPPDQTVLFSSPMDPDVKLQARLLPYTRKQQLLWVSDVSRAQRLEQMRRDFVANASHELRTPLTVISGYLEALQDSLGPDQSNLRQVLGSMRQQSERMMSIIRDLLLLSRLENADEPIRRVPVDVPSLLRKIAEDARSLSSEREHDIELEVEPALWIAGVEQELHSAIANLVFNAVQHTPPGSRIRLRWYRDDEGVHLDVEDDGDGIPAHHLPRLSERFYRVDRSRQQREGGRGTGLGLAIVKHVLQRHDGRLRIASEVGIGSCFSCDFPLSARVAPPHPRLLDSVA
jgi:two-component system, OmpR family, phosphate regulon sensor histidine kinase PhoR